MDRQEESDDGVLNCVGIVLLQQRHTNLNDGLLVNIICNDRLLFGIQKAAFVVEHLFVVIYVELADGLERQLLLQQRETLAVDILIKELEQQNALDYVDQVAEFVDCCFV